MKFFAVIGCPILHSLSPAMHNESYLELGVRAHYTRIISDSAKEAIRLAKELGISGLNVTSPFKADAFHLCDSVDDISKEIGAVNTITIADGKLSGFNTDALALKDFISYHSTVTRRALVLGAGGAAKAALFALRKLGFSCIISNRTIENALRLKTQNEEVQEFTYESLQKLVGEVSVIVSTVPTDNILKSPLGLTSNHVVIDAIYGSKSAIFLEAKKAGSIVYSGLDWLVAQGALAFEIFTGQKAPIQRMKESLIIPRPSRISLTGMMGAGKSSVGKILARKLNLDSVDTDAAIEKYTGDTIKNIFLKKKEAGFREIEREVTENAIKTRSLVITGGGSVIHSATRELLKTSTEVIYLYTTIDALEKRLTNAQNRPLLSGSKPVRESLGRLIEDRGALYLASSSSVIDTSCSSPEQIAEKLAKEYNAISRV